ncbi:uncharacterized protein LOC117793306 [Drosophila innubila]|uniref:uncharacterized protein LOC117793306 n=1 Tax=Drosophila innubila TaxID=198719 RepID=UPI00148C4C87|nr:uncharacterized protein LOC117793306 [Drosophila innubila]
MTKYGILKSSQPIIMALHWDVTCDGCEKTNLVGYRYKCLRCDNYDLCSECYESELETADHSRNHPFQCLLDRAARELHFNGAEIPDLCADSFTCPICGKMGHAAKELVKHVQSKHLGDNTPVICPLCAAVPSADTLRMSNLVNHMTVMHGTSILRIGGGADNNQVVCTEAAEWPPIGHVHAQSHGLGNRRDQVLTFGCGHGHIPAHGHGPGAGPGRCQGLGQRHGRAYGHGHGHVNDLGHGRLIGCFTDCDSSATMRHTDLNLGSMSELLHQELQPISNPSPSEPPLANEESYSDIDSDDARV